MLASPEEGFEIAYRSRLVRALAGSDSRQMTEFFEDYLGLDKSRQQIVVKVLLGELFIGEMQRRCSGRSIVTLPEGKGAERSSDDEPEHAPTRQDASGG